MFSSLLWLWFNYKVWINFKKPLEGLGAESILCTIYTEKIVWYGVVLKIGLTELFSFEKVCHIYLSRIFMKNFKLRHEMDKTWKMSIKISGKI